MPASGGKNMCERMNWIKLLSEKRFYGSDGPDKKTSGSPKTEKNGRSQFQKDIDRITFSSAFRRLGRKTQVHLLSENDHIHTRLSHSLEAACVGRSLGVKVGQWLQSEKEKLPKDFSASMIGEIVQAACLAHDIGNPPFGHAAEEAIRKWFQEDTHGNKADWKRKLGEAERWDLERFDGNAMAFRVVTNKEYYEGKGGMRLTYATLGALLKYPWTSHFAGTKNKFSCFQTEYASLCEIAGELRLAKKIQDRSQSKAEYARHPLAYLVEAADDICYHVLDIEDAIELHILPDDYLKTRFASSLDSELSDVQRSLLDDDSVSSRIKNGLLRGRMIGRMIDEVVDVFTTHYNEIMQGNLERSLLSQMNDSNLCCKLQKTYKKENLSEKIYRNHRNVPLELGAFSLLRTLLDAATEAAYEIFNGKDISYKTQIIRKFMKQDHEDRFKGKSLYQIIMLFLDYVMGMTDSYATDVNKQLLGLGN